MNPLSEEQFNAVIAEAIKNYSPDTGSLVQLRTKKKRSPYSLCISHIRNEGLFIPAYCVLWDDGKILFQGRLDSKVLLNKINKREICCFEFTNVVNIENNIPGYCTCFGDRETCKVKKCKCKLEDYWQKMLAEHPRLASPVVKAPQGEVKQCVLDAWNQGWKQAREDKVTKKMRKLIETNRSRCSDSGESNPDNEENDKRTAVQPDIHSMWEQLIGVCTGDDMS